MRLTGRRDEQGSMIIALSVIMILSALAVAVMARTLSGQDSARRHQEFTGALAKADAGISDALFRLDQVGNGSVPTQFCVGTSSSCTVAALPGSTNTVVSRDQGRRVPCHGPFEGSRQRCTACRRGDAHSRPTLPVRSLCRRKHDVQRFDKQQHPGRRRQQQPNLGIPGRCRQQRQHHLQRQQPPSRPPRGVPRGFLRLSGPA